MMVGPGKAISGPNEPPPVKPGHRGQLARLIRERLVFVNLPGHVRRSELRELHAAGSTRDLQIEKRYSNHKLAGIHGFPDSAKPAAGTARKPGSSALLSPESRHRFESKGLSRCYFRDGWRWTLRDHKSQAADISER